MATACLVAFFFVSVGLLLAGWGVFVRLNRYAEELEPEAMEEAKREDRKLKASLNSRHISAISVRYWRHLPCTLALPMVFSGGSKRSYSRLTTA